MNQGDSIHLAIRASQLKQGIKLGNTDQVILKTKKVEEVKPMADPTEHSNE
jgi:hypothetical protein